jgi:hypothetical protein
MKCYIFCKTHHQLAADILIAIIGLTFLDAAFPTRWPRRPALNGRKLIPHIHCPTRPSKRQLSRRLIQVLIRCVNEETCWVIRCIKVLQVSA